MKRYTLLGEREKWRRKTKGLGYFIYMYMEVSLEEGGEGHGINSKKKRNEDRAMSYIRSQTDPSLSFYYTPISTSLFLPVNYN